MIAEPRSAANEASRGPNGFLRFMRTVCLSTAWTRSTATNQPLYGAAGALGGAGRRVIFVSIGDLPSFAEAPRGGWGAGPPRLAPPLALGAEAGIEDVPQSVSQQVEAEHQQHHRGAGEDRHPRRELHVLATGAQHCAPGRVRRLDG